MIVWRGVVYDEAIYWAKTLNLPLCRSIFESFKFLTIFKFHFISRDSSFQSLRQNIIVKKYKICWLYVNSSETHNDSGAKKSDAFSSRKRRREENIDLAG